MGYHRRRGQRYFCRSVRRNGKVRRVYFGKGAVADLAAQADRLRKFEEQVSEKHWREQKEIIDEALRTFEQLDQQTDQMQAAILFISGFHKPSGNRPWRGWRDGQRVLNEHD